MRISRRVCCVKFVGESELRVQWCVVVQARPVEAKRGWCGELSLPPGLIDYFNFIVARYVVLMNSQCSYSGVIVRFAFTAITRKST